MVLGRVDIADDPADDVPAALPVEAERCDPIELAIGPQALLRRGGEDCVVGQEAFAVVEHRSTDAEEANRDDGHHQVHDRRMLGRADDQPGGGQQQPDRGELRTGTEPDAGRERELMC